MRKASFPLAPVVGDVSQSRFNQELLDTLRRTEASALAGQDIEILSGALVAGTNRVKHFLGRVPTGWVVTRKTGNADLWEGEPPTDDALYLVTDNLSCEFRVRVF